MIITLEQGTIATALGILLLFLERNWKDWRKDREQRKREAIAAKDRQRIADELKESQEKAAEEVARRAEESQKALAEGLKAIAERVDGNVAETIKEAVDEAIQHSVRMHMASDPSIPKSKDELADYVERAIKAACGDNLTKDISDQIHIIKHDIRGIRNYRQLQEEVARVEAAAAVQQNTAATQENTKKMEENK